MAFFHQRGNKKGYFEGWYFKHQTNDTAIAFIPGYHIKENGDKSTFIQVILPDGSYQFEFPFERFHACRDRLYIQIADNIFCDQGVSLNLKNEHITICGEINYNKFTPLKSDAMGPFRFVPFMQCSHGVISMHHKLRGSLKIQNRPVNFDGGIGYIETDRGSSFPQSYLWAQMSSFDKRPCSVMVSIADIPFAGFRFRGCIGIVLYGGQEYRMATYNGVKIERFEKDTVILTRGKYRLEINASPTKTQKLLAPTRGHMIREIHESVSCEAQAGFFIDNELLFHIKSDKAGFEFV